MGLTNHLVGLENEHCAALFPAERWLLNYWLEDYTAVLGAVARYNSAFQNALAMKIFPEEDYLFPKLKEQVRKDRLLFLFRIEESALTTAEKKFLTLHLNYLLMGYDDPDITQEVLNAAPTVDYEALRKAVVKQLMEIERRLRQTFWSNPLPY